MTNETYNHEYINLTSQASKVNTTCIVHVPTFKHIMWTLQDINQ